MTQKNWFLNPSAALHSNAKKDALTQQSQLTKPAGSLGQLENIAVQFAQWQNTPSPVCDNISIRIFAADHGIAQQNVSAYPQEVTAQMVHNFLQGGAAISVLAKRLKADFAVVNAGVKHPIIEKEHSALIQQPLASGSADFSQTAAMSANLVIEALNLGRDSCKNRSTHLFIAGDMGIGNTTSASALYCALLDITPFEAVGPGTGIDQHAMQRKCALIEQALLLHRNSTDTPLTILQTLGGLEIAAITGAYIHCAQQGIPILVDGFICTAAALVACEINSSVRNWMLFAHQSAEPAHALALKALHAEPLLELGMRLGEGSGAAMAVPLLQDALALHNNMATFNSANVETKKG